MIINWKPGDSRLLRNACLIGGEWMQANSGKTIDVENPAIGVVIGAVPNMGTLETWRALELAHAAPAALAIENG